MFLIVYYLIVSALAAKCSESQTNCANEKCETVGKIEVCTQCKPTFVPINGKCTAKAEATNCKKANGSDLTDDDTKCGKCEGATFMYKGGCYVQTAPPGQTICQTAGSDGTCTTCSDANGYFKNPAAAATSDSCIPCSDTTGVEVSDKTYKGVANCAKCDGSELKTGTSGIAKCTECTTNLYLKTETSGTSCVANNECTGGFFPMTDTADSNKKKCLACGDATNGVDGCEKCTAPGKGKTKPTCTKCTDKYLKTVDGATTCVTECGPGFFNNNNGGDSSNLKVCSPCAANCLACADETADKCTSCTAGTHFLLAATGSQGKCLSCGDTDAGVPNCAKCNPPTGNAKPICTACRDGYKLEGGACVPAGTNLSTGAIAGISVAAVVVVGGLVGFLCWWFICRGKA